jgi:hypothetical protein
MDLLRALNVLREKRPLFHSEADFQFALAWEIQRLHPRAEIRLEYPSVGGPNRYVDILVRIDGCAFPIELKYKTKRLSTVIHGEQYDLKNHGAQDLGAYDFVKDICRVETFASHLPVFQSGNVLWLTNEPYYWTPPRSQDVGYTDFSVHNGAVKHGTMRWRSHLAKAQ